MRWIDRALLVGTGLAASLSIAMPFVTAPQAGRIAPAILIVFVLPGFAAVGAVFPAGRLAPEERIVGSLGISLAIAICTAVLLGATPVGLSQKSFAVVLGASTATLSVVALLRSFAGSRWRPGDNKQSLERTSAGTDLEAPSTR